MRSTPNATIRDHLPPSPARVYILPSWVDDYKSECCEWERVTCNSTTGHVTHLSLRNIGEVHIKPAYYDPDSFDYEDRAWFLNVSLFESFKELRSLDLSLNAIGGWIEHKGMLIYIISLFLIICNDCNLSYVNISFGRQIDRYRRKNKTQKIVIFITSTLLHRSLLFSSLASVDLFILLFTYLCVCVCLLTPKFFFFGFGCTLYLVMYSFIN